MKTAVYTGSFDPFHLGHEQIVRRAADIFDEVVVGVGINPEKHALFTPQQRVDMIDAVVGDLANVRAACFSGLTVQFVRECGSDILLRGIRALADMDLELTMTLTNRQLDPGIETVFLMAEKEWSHLSSSLIRQIAKFGGKLDGFVPRPVIGPLRDRLAAKEAP